MAQLAAYMRVHRSAPGPRFNMCPPDLTVSPDSLFVGSMPAHPMSLRGPSKAFGSPISPAMTEVREMSMPGMVTSHLPLVRYHRHIERVGLDLADRPDAAEGVGLDGVDHRGLVAVGGQEVEQGHPVVARGLHSDQAVLRGRAGLAEPLQHLREATRRVV